MDQNKEKHQWIFRHLNNYYTQCDQANKQKKTQNKDEKNNSTRKKEESNTEKNRPERESFIKKLKACVSRELQSRLFEAYMVYCC